MFYPNSSKKIKVKNIPLIDERGKATLHLERLRKLFTHESYGPYNILLDKNNVPAGLSSRKIWEALHGKSIKFMREDHFEYLLKEFESSSETIHSSYVPERSFRLLSKEGEPTEYLEKLRNLKKVKGIGSNQLLGKSADAPAGLNPRKLNNYLLGRIRIIPLEHFLYLVATWETLPDVGSSAEYVQLLDGDGNDTDVLKEIKEHHARTGVGSYGLLKYRHDIPQGLTKAKIDNWIHGNTRYAQQDYIQYVSRLWRALPDAEKRTPITPEIRSKLIALVRDTNIKAPTFIRETKGRAPEGLQAAEISGWLNRNVKTATSNHLEFFLNELENILKCQKTFVKISPEIRSELLFEKRRTGVSPKALLRKQTDLPDGFIKSWVSGWLSRKIEGADEVHLDYVLKKWREIPDAGSYSAPPTEKISHVKMPRVKRSAPVMKELTGEMKEYLKSKFMIVTMKSFLRRFSPVPDGLNVSTISRWMSSAAKKADKTQLDFVLNKLSEIPNESQDSKTSLKDIKNASPRINRATIGEDDIKEMKEHQARTGVGGIRLLRNAKDTPEGLSANMISAWLNGHIQTAVPSHVKYVLKLWRKAPDRAMV